MPTFLHFVLSFISDKTTFSYCSLFGSQASGFSYDDFSGVRFAFHRTNPHVTLDQYRSRILHKFGQIVSKKAVVYLDLKFWINLRKASLGEKVANEYIELLSLLSNEVKRGSIVCPLSFWIFEELLKQSDLSTRKATSRLIDRLSNGVAFMRFFRFYNG